MRPPRLRCTLFPLTYPPHLLVLPATFGLHLFWQTYPYFRALYVISVRRTKSLLTASFRFHLTIDTLAVRLYTSSLPRRVRDFHPLERAHGAQTKKASCYRMLFDHTYIFHDFLTAIHALLIHYILYRLSLQKLYFQCLCQLLILPAASYRNPDILSSVRNLSREILNQNLLFQKLLILRRQNPKAQSRHPIGL